LAWPPVLGLAAACLALTLSACAPQPTCLELIPVRGTAVDDLGVAGPVCLQDDEVTARFETATWADLQAQAREVTGDPALTLSVGALDIEPNHPTRDERLVFLADDLGRMYGFEPSSQTLRVIQPSALVRAEQDQAVSHKIRLSHTRTCARAPRATPRSMRLLCSPTTAHGSTARA